MKNDDKELLRVFELYEVGIKTTRHDKCGGEYIFQRVINKAGTPYSIIVCRKCGFEIYSVETSREKQLIEYANEMFSAEEHA